MGESAVRVEACVDTVESARAAEAGGADRLELCDNLLEGGTTPSAAMVEVCRQRTNIPIFMMIRPRGGDFLYAEDEFAVMRGDVARAAELGAAGVVFGLLHADGSVDVERTRVLTEMARPLGVTFHRAFDAVPDADAALDALLEAGVDRVLTSGRAPTAEAGIDVIRRMVRRADGRLSVMAGAGVGPDNVLRIIQETGVREVHLRAAMRRPSQMTYRNADVDFRERTSLPDDVLEVTDPQRIARVAAIARGATAPGSTPSARGSNR